MTQINEKALEAAFVVAKRCKPMGGHAWVQLTIEAYLSAAPPDERVKELEARCKELQDQLKPEAERLREALMQIKNRTETVGYDWGFPEVAKIARAALAASPKPSKETTMQIDAATRDLCARAIFGELAPDDQLWDSLTDDEREQYRLAVDRVAAFAASPKPTGPIDVTDLSNLMQSMTEDQVKAVALMKERCAKLVEGFSTAVNAKSVMAIGGNSIALAERDFEIARAIREQKDDSPEPKEGV